MVPEVVASGVGSEVLQLPEQFLFQLLRGLQQFVFLPPAILLKLEIEIFSFLFKFFMELEPLLHSVINQGFMGLLPVPFGPLQGFMLGMKGERIQVLIWSFHVTMSRRGSPGRVRRIGRLIQHILPYSRVE
uniref:Uncharacterized protein n=1 Tax=Sphaerodactylus townsendi TaxID=933632 RepID=A0ACB8FHC5_9SAUR